MGMARGERKTSVESLACAPNRGLLRDVVAFALRTKKWWLLPLLLAFAVSSALALLGGTGLAPFIYPLS